MALAAKPSGQRAGGPGRAVADRDGGQRPPDRNARHGPAERDPPHWVKLAQGGPGSPGGDGEAAGGVDGAAQREPVDEHADLIPARGGPGAEVDGHGDGLVSISRQHAAHRGQQQLVGRDADPPRGLADGGG